MTTEPLHNAILRVLEVCNRKRGGAAGGWREVEDLSYEGLADAKLDRGPVVHVREFMGMPPGSVVPGVAYLTKDGFTCLRVGRTDEIRRYCHAAYTQAPSYASETVASGRTYPAETAESTLIGQVVDVLILVDYKPQPDNSPPATGGFMHQGTFVEQPGDYGIQPKA